MLNFVEIEQLLFLQEAMYNYNETQVSPYDPTRLEIRSILRPVDDPTSNCGQNFQKPVFFDDIVYFIHNENIVTYIDFDCCIIFYRENPTTMRQINRERN